MNINKKYRKLKSTIKKNSEISIIVVFLILGLGMMNFSPLDIISTSNSNYYAGNGIKVVDNNISLAKQTDQNLEIHYPFSDAYDYSGNNDHGTLINDALISNNYLVLDGDNDYYDVDASVYRVGTGSFTMSMNVIVTSEDGSNDFYFKSSAGSDDRLYLSRLSSGDVQFKVGTNNGCLSQVSDPFTVGQEYTIHAVGDSGSATYLYIDGELAASKTSGCTYDLDGTSNTKIGDTNTNSPLAKISNYKFRTEALSSSDISQDYANSDPYVSSEIYNFQQTLVNESNLQYCMLEGTHFKPTGTDITYSIDGNTFYLNEGFSYGGNESIQINIELDSNGDNSLTPWVELDELNCQATPFSSGGSSSNSLSTVKLILPNENDESTISRISQIIATIKQIVAEAI